MSDTPKKFVNLHAHSGYSIFDGFGMPSEHIDFVRSNGGDAYALTDHGNQNGLGNAFEHHGNLKKKGIDFKFIPGVEAYYHPDLEQWREEKYLADIAKKEAKKTRKKDDDSPIDEGQSEGTLIENEEETKDTSKWFNPINRRHHLVLLPKSRKGLENIFRLVTRSYKEGFYRFPRIDRKMLKECGEDVIVSTACIGSAPAWDVFYELRNFSRDQLAPELLDRENNRERILSRVGNTFDALIDAVGRENVFAEIQFNKLSEQHVVNRVLLEFAERNSIGLVATADSHYPHPTMWKAREMYKRLGWLGSNVELNPDLIPKSVEDLKCELYPKNAEQMWDSYLKYRGQHSFYKDDVVRKAIENSWHIAHDMIGDVSIDTSVKLPKSVIPYGMTAFQALLQMCKEGLIRRGLANRPEYIERLKMELKIIKEKGYDLYFLTMRVIQELAENQQLCGPGRGSSAGSLVNYLLNITQVDPIKYNLSFYRFISPQRKGMPDIDQDYENRDWLIDALRERFGTDNVIPISNFATLKLKSLTKDISKFHGIPFEEVNEATKTVEEDVKNNLPPADDEQAGLFELKYEDAVKYSPKYAEFVERHPEITEYIKPILKQIRAVGRHASGVLVAEGLESKMPIIAARGELQTPWIEGQTAKHLEMNGFLKFDLLGLDTLRIFRRCIELVLQRHHNILKPTFQDIKQWYYENLHPDNNDLDDLQVYQNVYWEGRFPAIFQFANRGAQQFIQKFKPVCIEDIAIATSIYRPGPLAAKVDKLYLEARENPENIHYEHPLVKQVLETYRNCIIFQETTMDIASVVGGFPPEETDDVRKIISKRTTSGKEDELKKIKALQDKFVAGAVKNGLRESDAVSLFERVRNFAAYGFNKSHAVSYAINSYHCAYLFTYYPDEWMCAYLDSSVSDSDDLQEAISIAKGLGYQIKKIDINYAGLNWAIVGPRQLMPSFMSCSGVGVVAAQEILENRPYKDIFDLLWDENGAWKHSKFNKKVLDHLIQIEAFDSMNIAGPDCYFSNYRQMASVLIEHYDDIKKVLKTKPNYGRDALEKARLESLAMEDWTKPEKLAIQQKHLGQFNLDLILPPSMQKTLAQRGVKSINEFEHPGLHWIILNKVELRKAKASGREYLVCHGIGAKNKVEQIFIWGGQNPNVFEMYTGYITNVKRGDFGFSANFRDFRKIL